MHFYYLWPALSAAIYALAALLTKRALVEGAGVMRFTFVCNLAFVPVFLLPALLRGGAVEWAQVGWPIAGGVFFFGGQILTVAALRLGDVSVQSPLMGSKAVFVAVLSVLTGAEAVAASWWSAAGLTAIAVFLLGFSSWRQSRRTWWAVGLALSSAATFAVSDVIVMAHASEFGVSTFLAIVMGTQALLSLAMLPFFRDPLSTVPRPAWGWLLGACLLMALQALILNQALGIYGHATPFNVIYSSRGLWSVLLVWSVGRYFGNTELVGGGRLLARRFIGAALLVVAVLLVLIES